MRQQFQLHKPSVLIAECVVFEASIAASPAIFRLPVSVMAWVNENTDRDGQIARMNQVVEDNGSSNLTIFALVGVSILKNHDTGRLHAIVLSWHIDVVLPRGSFKDLAFPDVFGDLALRHTYCALRFCA